MRRSLKQLADLSKEHEFDVLVAIFPSFPVAEPYEFHSDHAWIQRAMDINNLPRIDLLEDMQACSKKLNRSLGADSLHPTAEGHHCAGKALARYIMSHKRRNTMP